MNWTPLQTELAKSAYTALSDQDAAAAIAALPPITSLVLGSWVDKRSLDAMFGITRRRQIMAALTAIRDSAGTIPGLDADACANIGEIVAYINDVESEGVDMGLEASQTYADQMTALPDVPRGGGATVLTTDEAATLKARGQLSTSWTSANLGVPLITDHDVSQVRAGLIGVSVTAGGGE